MRILIATDPWHPQVNGVVRTLTSLARSASALGAEIDFLTPDGFPSSGVPTYPGLRIALPNQREIAARIEAVSPDAIHIATEGPIGWAVRAYCRRRKLAFTTFYTTRETCRSFALERSWENSARQFIGNLSALQPSRSLRPPAHGIRADFRRSTLDAKTRSCPMRFHAGMNGRRR